MKNQKFILFIAAIAMISMAFISRSNTSNEESELFRPQWGTVVSIDTYSGCMTIKKCYGEGTFTFGILTGGGPSSYPQIGTGIMPSLSSNSSACNGLLMTSWTVRKCNNIVIDPS